MAFKVYDRGNWVRIHASSCGHVRTIRHTARSYVGEYETYPEAVLEGLERNDTVVLCSNCYGPVRRELADVLERLAAEYKRVLYVLPGGARDLKSLASRLRSWT